MANSNLQSLLGITTYMQIENKFSEFVKIESVWHGRVFSSDLFNLYNKSILRKLEDLPGCLFMDMIIAT